MSRLREELAPAYLLPQQPGSVPERVADKAELTRLCAAADVPHPLTVIPDSATQAASAAWRLGLPVVAKWSYPGCCPPIRGCAARSWCAPPRRRATCTCAPPRPAANCCSRPSCRRARTATGSSTATPTAPGRSAAAACGRKLCAWPRGAGLTAVGEWTENPQVRTLAQRLTDELGYRGIFDLDFRRCGATGDYHLLDFNPRPGAQFRLFADGAGLDVVRAQHLDLTHRPLLGRDAAAGPGVRRGELRAAGRAASGPPRP